MKSKHKNWFFALLLIALMATSCDDIVEKNISNEVVNVIGPQDNYISDKYDVTFMWEKINKVQKYHLQIVKPSFDSLQDLVVDTLSSDNKITIILQPGHYQWRLRGENSNSITAYITRSIVVDTNIDLSGLTFLVNAPVDNFYSNTARVIFSWSAFPFATSYEYVLYDSAYNQLRSRVTVSFFVTDTLSEGSYKWRVRGLSSINSTSTQYSSYRTIVVDETPPAKAILFQPANTATVPNPILLKWNRAADVVADSLIISEDSTFQTTFGAYYTANAQYNMPPLVINNTYYWKVRSKDAAGNWSLYSDVYRFTVSL